MTIDDGSFVSDRARAVAAQDTILAVVYHDLRNPLNAIQLKAHLMSNSPDSQRRSEGDFIARRAGEMNRLIEDLLDISSIEAGRLRLEKSRQAVLRLLKEVLAVWKPHAAQNSLGLDCECPDEDELDLNCDPNRILQVLNNLIGNAIKFTGPGGTIHVRVERRANEVCFSVTDSGPGLPEAALPHLFHRFTRASTSSRRGTGLGLSLAQRICATPSGRTGA